VGLIGFGLVPSLQLRVVGLAGPGAELAATLSASAINVGIAGGSVIGGLVLERFGVAGPDGCCGLVRHRVAGHLGNVRLEVGVALATRRGEALGVDGGALAGGP